MDRKNFWYKQLVTEAQLDAAFDDAEDAIDRVVSEWASYGIITGGTATAQLVPDFTVNIAGPLYGYDPQGKRLHHAAASTILDCSIDRDAVVTQPSLGKEKYILALAGFDRTLSDPHLDGHGLTVYWQQSEAVIFEVVQGAEANPGFAVPPAIPSDRLCLAVILLANPAGTTVIQNADIYTEIGAVKRSDWLYYSASGYVTLQQYGTPHAAVNALFDRFANLAADEMTKTTPPDWCSSIAWESGPGTTVDTVIDAMMDSLATVGPVSGISGADRIGTRAWGPFADASTIAAGNLGINLDTLCALIGSVGGELLLGTDAWISGGAYSMTGGTLRAQLREIVANLNDHVANGGGNHNAAAITFTPGQAWYGAAETIAAVNVQDAIAEVISDLVAVTSGAKNGANYIGAFGQAGTPTALVTGSIYSQLSTLLTAVNDCVRMTTAPGDQELTFGLTPTLAGAADLGSLTKWWGYGNFNDLLLTHLGSIAVRAGGGGEIIKTKFHADPDTVNTYDLGTAAHGWRNIYFTTDVLATAALTRYRVIHPYSCRWYSDGEDLNDGGGPADNSYWKCGLTVGNLPSVVCLNVSSKLLVPITPEVKDGETITQILVSFNPNGAAANLSIVKQDTWDSGVVTVIDTLTTPANVIRTTYDLTLSSPIVVANDEMWWVMIEAGAPSAEYFGARIALTYQTLCR